MARALRITVIGRGQSCERFTEQLQRTAGDQNVRKADPAEAADVREPGLRVLHIGTRTNGILGLLSQLATTGSHGPIVLCGEAHDDAQVLDALIAGAQGFLPNDMAPELLLERLRKASAGHVVLSDGHLAALVRHLRAQQQPALNGLSTREQEVLRYVARGSSYKRVAERLSISPFTVKNHMHRILRKLGVRTRIEAVHRYLSTGGK